MKTVIVVFFVILSASSNAQNTMGLHIGTYHSSNIECDNGNNPGVYFHASNGLTVGAYHNSCERQSAYIGYKTPDWHGVAIMAIAVTGYDRPVTPVAFPTAAMRIGDVRLRVSGGTWDNKTVVHFPPSGVSDVPLHTPMAYRHLYCLVCILGCSAVGRPNGLAFQSTTRGRQGC